MEQAELSNSQADNQTPALHISKDATFYWPATRNWSLFSAITGFLGAALLLLVLVLLFVITTRNQDTIKAEVGVALLVYFGWFVLALTMSILLLLFSNSLNRAVRYGHPEDTERSAGSLLRYFRVAGIFSIIAVLVQVFLLFNFMVNLNSGRL